VEPVVCKDSNHDGGPALVPNFVALGIEVVVSDEEGIIEGFLNFKWEGLKSNEVEVEMSSGKGSSLTPIVPIKDSKETHWERELLENIERNEVLCNFSFN
jgi:hypothetical protein